MAGVSVLLAPGADTQAEYLIREVLGPARVFVDVAARFSAKVTFASRDVVPSFPSQPLQWRLLDQATGTEVPFRYWGAQTAQQAHAGWWFLHIKREDVPTDWLDDLQRSARRLVLSVRLHPDLPGADFAEPVLRPVELTDVRIVAFPGTPEVPIYTQRSFSLDVPEGRQGPDGRFFVDPPRVARVEWSALVATSAGMQELEGPAHTIAAGDAAYPDLGWSAQWTNGGYAAYNRLALYTINCRVTYGEGSAPQPTPVQFAGVQHQEMPDLAIVELGDLPAMLDRRSTLRVDSDPKLCTNLPRFADSHDIFGVYFVWTITKQPLAGRPVAELPEDDDTWRVIDVPGQPSPQSVSVPLGPWTKAGDYVVRCAVTLSQYPTPPEGGFATRLYHRLTVVPKEPALRLAYGREEPRTPSLVSYMESMRLKAEQLRRRYPGSALAGAAESAHARLLALVQKHFATSTDHPIVVTSAEARPIAGIFVAGERQDPIPLRFYWGPDKELAGTLTLIDAVGDELGLPAAVYKADAGSDGARRLVAEFLNRQTGNTALYLDTASYPLGDAVILDDVCPFATGIRRFYAAMDEIASAAALVGVVLMLVPEPGMTKLVGTVLVVSTGAYFAWRSGGRMLGELQTESFSFDRSETWFDLMNVVGGVVGVAGFTGQVRAGYHVLRRGDSLRFYKVFFGETVQASSATRAFAVINTMSDFGGVTVTSADVAVKIDAVLSSNATLEQKHAQIFALLLVALGQNALLFVGMASAIPARKLWRRSFWRSLLDEARKERPNYLSRIAEDLGGPLRDRVDLPPQAALSRGEFYDFIRRFAPNLERAFQATQWQEMLGIFGHIKYLQRRFGDRFAHFVVIGGPGRPDLLFLDMQPPGGGAPRLVVCEVKGTAGQKSFTVESDLRKSRRLGPRTVRAVEATAEYLRLPSQSGPEMGPHIPVINDTLEALAAPGRGAQAYGDAADLALIREQLQQVATSGTRAQDFDRQYAFSGPDPRMSAGQLRALDTAAAPTLIAFHQTDASLVISPQLFRRHLDLGYNQIMRITNAQLAREAFIELVRPEDEAPLPPEQRSALETLLTLLRDGVTLGFDDTRAANILRIIGTLDDSLRWAMLEAPILALAESGTVVEP